MNYQIILYNAIDAIFDLESNQKFKTCYNLQVAGNDINLLLYPSDKMLYLKWLERYKMALSDIIVCIDYYNANKLRR